MIPYRFLAPAEEEMSEAALFYETAANGLGNDFLDDVERAIETLSDYPELGEPVDAEFRRMLLHRFPGLKGNVYCNNSRSSGWPPWSAQPAGVLPTFVSLMFRSAPWSRRNSIIARCPFRAA